MVLRIFVSIILLLSVLFMPFWVSAILALAAMAYFHIFLEAVVIFFIADLLYGVPSHSLFNLVFVSFGMAIASLAIIELLKSKLRLKTPRDDF